MVQLRLVGAVLVARTLVGGAVLNAPDGASADNPSLRQVLDRTEAVATAGTKHPRGDSFMNALHEGEQSRKNAISRDPESGSLTQDPTTPAQARTAADAVAQDVAVRRTVEAERAKPRATARAVTFITLGLLVVGAFNRAYLAPYSTPLGQLVLALIAAGFVGCLMWMRALTLSPPEPRFVTGPALDTAGVGR